ncbi:MAG: hypothetical protein HYT80_06125 [Euryarchaeota archaeon]|nr:hypothetical protein [Euryarchaeota archaeon]
MFLLVPAAAAGGGHADDDGPRERRESDTRVASTHPAHVRDVAHGPAKRADREHHVDPVDRGSASDGHDGQAPAPQLQPADGPAPDGRVAERAALGGGPAAVGPDRPAIAKGHERSLLDEVGPRRDLKPDHPDPAPLADRLPMAAVPFEAAAVSSGPSPEEGLQAAPGAAVLEAAEPRVAPPAQPMADALVQAAGPSTPGLPLGGGSPEPEWETVWGRVGSLLNQSSGPSRASEPNGAAKVASAGTPWLVWGLGAVFGVGIGIGAATRLVRRLEPRKPAPEAAAEAPEDDASTRALTMPDLVNRVKTVPFDAAACFSLAVMMLQTGAETDGLRYLDRCFHLDPLYVLRLLKDERYAVVRQQTGVRQLLMKIKRDQDHRAWSGYA